MNPVTTQQLKAIHALLHKHQLLAQKANIVESFSNGRSSSSKDLTTEEARELIMHFNAAPEASNKDNKGPMMRKLFAMAFEIGWISKVTVATQCGNIDVKKDYSRLYGWVQKYGYLRKELRKYTYKEMPKLVSQFEFNIYNPYIQKINK
jgi:hypothetical protein